MHTKQRNNFKKRQWDLGQKRCAYCCIQLNWALDQKNSASVDHIICVVHGGTNIVDNLLLVCHSCNNSRGDMRLDKWVRSNKGIPNVSYLRNRYQRAYKSVLTHREELSRNNKRYKEFHNTI